MGNDGNLSAATDFFMWLLIKILVFVYSPKHDF